MSGTLEIKILLSMLLLVATGISVQASETDEHKKSL